jgi:hypothetical protein
MKIYAPVIAVTALLFLFTLFSGLLLSRTLRTNDPRPSGAPLTGLLPAVHKLLAVAMVICGVVTIRNLHRGIEFKSIELAALIVAAFLFVLLFVSGSLLSLAKARTDELQVVHKVGVLLAIIPAFGAIYLLTRGR